MARTSVAHWLIAIAALGGVSAPLRAQCPDGTPPPCAVAAPQARPAPNSIAVLTFENTTRDTSAQYLVEGLADQISTRLGGVARLTMISRSAVRRLHSPERMSIQQIGRSLNAAYLVSGAMRAAGGRVRVNVEAVRAATGEAVWSEAFDRANDDLIGLEEAIATEVAAGVAGRLSPQERRALGSQVTANSRAYEQFLRGNVLMARRSAAGVREAIVAFEAATAADPEAADAYGRLAYAYAECWGWRNGACRSDLDSLPGLSRQASTRALRLNPRSSDAWMGRAYLLVQWADAAGAAGDDSLLASLAALRRAVELNPRNDEAWHQYGSVLGYFSDSASLDALRRALSIDPTRAVTYRDLAWTYYVMGRNDRALAAIDSAVALEPDGPFRQQRVLFRLTAGDTAGAVADARVSPGNFWEYSVLVAFAHDSAVVRVLESKLTDSCDIRVAAYMLWTGRREQAVHSILGCGPSLFTRWWLRLPVFAPLVDDPRIQALRAETERILARARWW